MTEPKVCKICHNPKVSYRYTKRYWNNLDGPYCSFKCQAIGRRYYLLFLTSILILFTYQEFLKIILKNFFDYTTRDFIGLITYIFFISMTILGFISRPSYEEQTVPEFEFKY